MLHTSPRGGPLPPRGAFQAGHKFPASGVRLLNYVQVHQNVADVVDDDHNRHGDHQPLG